MTPPVDVLAVDLLVVGAGLRGLCCARSALRRGQRVLAVEAQPRPGGSAHTQRSEGFTCELGAFALPGDEAAALIAELDRPPPLVSLHAEARTGWTWTGTELIEAAVDGDPRAGQGGMEDFVTAFRRELGDALWLGRAVTAVRREATAWTVTLSGSGGADVEADVAASELALCVPLDATARLCAGFDPGLQVAAARLRRVAGAFVFLGAHQDQAAAALRGYGVLAEAPSPVREVIFCSNALPRRAAPGKVLVRIELGADVEAGRVTAWDQELDDRATAALAEAELRRITGWTGDVVFRRVHRTSALVHDGAYTECSVRLAEVARRVPGLLWSPRPGGPG